MRSKQKVKDALGPLKNDVGEIIPPGQQTANTLNKFFASVFTVEGNEVPVPEQIYRGPENEKLVDLTITVEDVKKKLEALDPSKATGPDGIYPCVLKSLADEVCIPIAWIYNKSLEEGIVPEDWRVAHVVPIFKKGLRSKPGNYRPHKP